MNFTILTLTFLFITYLIRMQRYININVIWLEIYQEIRTTPPTCTLDSGKLIFKATSSRMKISG